ncbi:MAG TPA: adenylate/guanylate cyclase domain-containing protein [Actinomycetota bacterium]
MSPKRGSTVLVTVVFTDIVGSTEIAADVGDRRWRDLVQRHHAVVRRELKRFGGKELDTAGDGFFASFDRPAAAIRCACAISDAVRELGLEIRAGLHLGEAEVLEDKIGGMAVNVGARVMGVAKGGEVLVSSTLHDAVVGSGFAFADHGTHRLKGIVGEWRLYEVTAVDGVRRSLPLSAEESRTRREFTEALPVRRHRDRILAAVAGGLVVALVAAGILTNAFGADDPGGSEPGLSDVQRSLLTVVPDGFRSTCTRSSSPAPSATASMDCLPNEMHAVTYASFGSTEDLRTAFDQFASPADPTHVDCARDPSARHDYTVNGTRVGEVACYTVEGTSLSTTDSVIVWTDEELLVLGRVVRGDAADLTLFSWWQTEAGPWDATSANPPKDGEPPDIIKGVFEAAGERWTLTFEEGRYQESRFGPHYGDAELLFAKPSTVLLYHRLAPQTFGGALCPNYEEYRWRLRRDRLSLDLVSGGCREYSSVDIGKAEWIRVD